MTTKHDALTFLQQHKLAVLSTQSAEGELDGAAIYYVSKDDQTLYFLTHRESRKFKNITANSAAALTIFDEKLQQTIQAKGKVAEVAIGQEHDEALRLLAKLGNKNSVWGPPVSKTQIGEIILCRFAVERMRFSDFKSARLHSGAHFIDIL